VSEIICPFSHGRARYFSLRVQKKSIQKKAQPTASPFHGALTNKNFIRRHADGTSLCCCVIAQSIARPLRGFTLIKLCLFGDAKGGLFLRLIF
jgi:hypothetical protein